MSNLFEKYLKIVKDPDNLAELSVICKFKLPFLVSANKINQDEYVQLLKAAYENLSSQIPVEYDEIEFGDEWAKTQWELRDRLKLVNALLPDESGFDQRHRIRLASSNSGNYVIQNIGTVTYLPSGIKIVSGNTVLVLKMLGIKFSMVS